MRTATEIFMRWRAEEDRVLVRLALRSIIEMAYNVGAMAAAAGTNSGSRREGQIDALLDSAVPIIPVNGKDGVK